MTWQVRAQGQGHVPGGVGGVAQGARPLSPGAPVRRDDAAATDAAETASVALRGCDFAKWEAPVGLWRRSHLRRVGLVRVVVMSLCAVPWQAQDDDDDWVPPEDSGVEW